MRTRLSKRGESVGDGSGDLRKRNDELEAKLRRTEDALANYREREALIAETLLTAQSAAHALREQVERDLEQERADAEELRRQAEQSRSELVSDVEWLRTMRTQMRDGIRSLLLNTLDALGGGPRPEPTERAASGAVDLERLTSESAQPSAQNETE